MKGTTYLLSLLGTSMCQLQDSKNKSSEQEKQKTMGLMRCCLLSCPYSSKQAMYTLAATTLGVDPSSFKSGRTVKEHWNERCFVHE
uniref:Uncharacterized protein n=1 Tax=Populus trichocarpa TaxID=3694 RepID=A0A2K1YB75_POPTR